MEYSKLNKYASFSLVLGPFIEPYALSDGGTAMFKLFMLLNILFFLYKGRRQKYENKLFNHFVLYALSIPTIIAILYGYTSSVIGSYLTLLLFVFNLILVIPHVRVPLLRQYYKYAIFICIVVFCLQELSYYATGTRFMALIPYFHTIYAGVDMNSFIAKMSMEDRSCSMFLEPSHFAHFLLPFLAMELGFLHDEGKLLNRLTIIISIVLLFLRSGNGLIVMAIIWVFAVLFSNLSRPIKYYVIFPLALFVSIYGFSAFSNTEMGQSILERTEELNTNITEVNSGFIRVWRGYYIFEEQPTIVQLFGVGYGGLENAVHNSRLQWMFFSSTDTYVNNVQAFLLSYGIIGTILFLLFLYKLCDKKSFSTSLVVITFISLCFLDNFFWSSKMLFILSIPVALNYSKYSQHETNTLYSNR